MKNCLTASGLATRRCTFAWCNVPTAQQLPTQRRRDEMESFNDAAAHNATAQRRSGTQCNGIVVQGRTMQLRSVATAPTWRLSNVQRCIVQRCTATPLAKMH